MPGAGAGPGIPARLRAEYGAWRWELVWQIVPTNAVHRLRSPDGEERFVKIGAGPQTVPLAGEAARLSWLAGHVAVPDVLDHGLVDEDGVERSWLVTAALAGADATRDVWRSDRARLVTAWARGLRRFHDDVPAEDCPFDATLDALLPHVERRVNQGRVDRKGFHREHAHHDPRSAYERLVDRRPAERDLVVAHGDYCPPNVLLVDWEVTAYLDVGEAGVADRWWDLAVATWSLGWNFGDGWEALFLHAYGADPDPGRATYYRLLYDLVS